MNNANYGITKAVFENNLRMTVKEAKEKFNEIFHEDLDFKEIVGTVGSEECLYVYFEGATDKNALSSTVIKPLTSLNERIDLDSVKKAATCFVEITEASSVEEASDFLVNGGAVLFVCDKFFEIPLIKFEKRSIAEPPTSSVIKGPRAGFVEDINTNVALLRGRLKCKELRIKKFVVGEYTSTTIAVCFIDGVADKRVVDAVSEKISKIDIDGIIDSSYIAALIEEDHSSIFSQIATQEKPDIVVAKLLEGRVAILADGSPMVLTAPHLLMENFQASDDYFKRKQRVSFIRILRLLGLFLATLLPAVYVAVQEYQYQLIPLKFMITVINATNGTPLSPTLEMFLVLILFDILNEASVRMPKYVGMALSIVGAIVLGETAVSAGLLSSPSVLIMALSAIGMYTTPDNIGTFSLIRLILLGLASVLGICGVLVGLNVFAAHVANLKSFYSDYTAPYSPLIFKDLKDGFIKGGLQNAKYRPKAIHAQNERRQK